jgi:Fe-S cluster assembly protein SufD
MTLAAVIKRSQTDREAWKYTSLEGLEEVGFKKQQRHSGESRNPSPKHDAREPLCLCGGEEMDPRFRGDDARLESVPRLVFLNGIWQPEASCLEGLPEGIMQGDAAAGYELTLAEQTCLVTLPVELLFINEAGVEPAEINVKLRIVLGASGRLTLIEKHVTEGTGEAQLAQVIETEIELGPQAKLVHGKIFSNGNAVAHLARTKVRADKGAYYDNFTLLRGGNPARNEIDVTLAGEMAQCRLYGAMLLRGSEHADTTTCITHAAPHGTSRQNYRSVMGDKARGVFQGKIKVAEGAVKTDGYQLSRALLLSDQAEMDAKPELEIYADDVKCSHGSTVGELDERALFYLRSRGIGEEEARALLIKAFVGELLDEIQTPALREAVQREVEGWLR